MPGLLINIADGRWVARVANTDIAYNFEGDTLAAQATNVQGFAETMAEGNPDVGFFLDAFDIGEAELAQQLFGTTDMILYSGNVIYGSVGEEVLMDELAEAGEALLAVL